MKKALRILAVLVLLAAGTTWLATGASRGWTKTSVMVKTADPVTGIDGISYEKKIHCRRGFSWRCRGGCCGTDGNIIFLPQQKTNTN